METRNAETTEHRGATKPPEKRRVTIPMVTIRWKGEGRGNRRKSLEGIETDGKAKSGNIQGK